MRKYEILEWTDVFKHDKEYRKEIKSVKRLSDGFIVAVNDDVQHIGMPSIRGKVTKIVEDAEGVRIYYHEGFAYLSFIQKLQKPEKDYEILEAEDETDEIHTVKRLSDGEVVSVGEIRQSRVYDGKIKRITEDEWGIWIHFSCDMTRLKNIRKSHKPILTTEDGVELFERDRRFWVNPDMDWGYGLVEVGDVKRDCKYFSTREKAEGYRLWHFRGLSLKDVLDCVDDPFTMGVKLKNLVKSRLK